MWQARPPASSHAEPPRRSGARARETRAAMSKSKRTARKESRRRDAGGVARALEGPSTRGAARAAARWCRLPLDLSRSRVWAHARIPARHMVRHSSPPATAWRRTRRRTRVPVLVQLRAEEAVAASPPATHAAPSSCGTTKRVDHGPGRTRGRPARRALAAVRDRRALAHASADARARAGARRARARRRAPCGARAAVQVRRGARRHADDEAVATAERREKPRAKARAVDTDAPTLRVGRPRAASVCARSKHKNARAHGRADALCFRGARSVRRQDRAAACATRVARAFARARPCATRPDGLSRGLKTERAAIFPARAARARRDHSVVENARRARVLPGADIGDCPPHADPVDAGARAALARSPFPRRACASRRGARATFATHSSRSI